MSDFNYLPSSISHKKLRSILEKAKKENSRGEKTELEPNEKEAFEMLLTEWHDLSKELLITLKNDHDSIVQHKSSKLVMALGAFETHLNFAIQAKKAYDHQQ